MINTGGKELLTDSRTVTLRASSILRLCRSGNLATAHPRRVAEGVGGDGGGLHHHLPSRPSRRNPQISPCWAEEKGVIQGGIFGRRRKDLGMVSIEWKEGE